MDELDYVPAFWITSANFGDACNLYLLSALSGLQVVFAGIAEPDEKIVAVGSILNWCNETCIAWGPGLAGSLDCVSPGARLRAVRGPLSRDRAHACGNPSSPALGDPVSLLPLVLRPQVEKRYRLGIVPHYVDQLFVRRYEGHPSSDTRVINILNNPEDVVRDLLSCERIVSSSLHGIIAAHAYGIPAAWVTFGGPIGGDGMKYRDYFESVGLHVPAAHDFSTRHDLESLEQTAMDIGYSLPKIDRRPELLQSAPFRCLVHA